MPSLKLPNVTLIAATSKDREGHEFALQKSSEEIDFGAVKLVWLEGLNAINSIEEWNYFIVYRLHHYVDTEFALLIHADGYVINPQLWRNEWLNYDYIGSPWPLPQDRFSYRDSKGEIIRVGNSVSLRSKRLLEYADKAHLPWQAFHGYTNEDGYICVNMRHHYTRAGMKFAPLEEAIHFGKEHEIPENVGLSTFVFHTIG